MRDLSYIEKSRVEHLTAKYREEGLTHEERAEFERLLAIEQGWEIGKLAYLSRSKQKVSE